VGDVVTRRTDDPDVTVTHRIVGTGEEGGSTVLWTKGDANDVADEEGFPDTDILGRVRFSIPWLGYIATFARTREGFLLLVVIPAVIVVYEELRKMKAEVVRLWRARRECWTMSRIRVSETPDAAIMSDRHASGPEANIGDLRFDGQRPLPKRRIV